MKKQLLLLIICLSISLLLKAQNNKTIHVTAGSLYELTNNEANTITGLTLTGTIDARDFKTMRDKMPVLAELDLSEATISAYNGSGGTYLFGSYGNYEAHTLPESAFYTYNSSNSTYVGKASLTSVILPSSLLSLGNGAFVECNNITTMVIPSSVTTISNRAFYACRGLTSVSIPSSVTSIEKEAFAGCYALKDISIPTSVTFIGVSAFESCSSLTSITIPSSVKFIEAYAFMGCHKIASITVSWFTPLDLSNSFAVFIGTAWSTCLLKVPYGTGQLYASANQWKDFTNIVEIQGLHLTAKSIHLGANGAPAKLSLGSSAEWNAVSDQPWLTLSPASGQNGAGSILTVAATAIADSISRTATITITATGFEPETVAVTQYGLTKVTAGNLKNRLAGQLSTIANLTLTGTIDARDFKTMRDMMPLLTDVNLSEATIGAYTGSEGTNTGSIDYPANEIPEYAFRPNSSGNSNLRSIVLPQSLTSIGTTAFFHCDELTQVVLPSRVTTIKEGAFYGCSALTSVILPSSVTTIRSSCFMYCTKLSSITVEASIPPDLNATTQVFYGVDKSICELKVPYGSAQDYRNAYEWKDFQNIVEETNGFHVSSNNVKVDGTAGSYATVEINSNLEWTASSDQDWLVVNPESGNGLPQPITFTAEANPSFINTRTAYVTISAPGVTSQNITVTQSVHPQSPKTWEATPGGLAAAFNDEELATIFDLTLTGSIDARDFKTMRDLMPLLAKLDLSGSTIVSYNGTEGTSLDGNTNYPANTIPEYAFIPQLYESQGKTTLTVLMLPESLTAIGPYSFALCPSLTNVIIPASVTDIGSYAFFGCRSISEITIPPTVTTIGLKALGYLNGVIKVATDNANYMSSNNVLFNKTQTELIQSSGLNSGSYEIPSTVTTIGAYAFSNCDLLTSVTIPSSVTFIGESAFEWCRQLNSIYAHSITPVDLNASVRVFYPVDTYGCTLYVPIGSKTAYQTANQWQDFWNIVEVNPDLIANAGPDKEIEEGTSCLLYGSFIANTGGKPLTYQWTAPEGITLSSVTDQYPIFTAPEVTDYTTYTFSLIVSDGLNTSTADQVSITVINVNKAPVANAGTDQIVNENNMVTLDGSASYDPDNDYINYEWTGPNTIYISSRYSAKATFKAPEVLSDSNFTFYLSVYDGYCYRTDTVVITVKQVEHVNQVPVANAGNVQMVSEGDIVTLDATHSTDPDGDVLTYKWTAPEGITLNSVTSATPSFTVPSVESDTGFTFKLVVNDGKVNSPPSYVNVHVRNVPSILNLLAQMNNPAIRVPVNFQLFMYDGNSFIHKRDTFAITGDSIHISIEPGYWIALVAPASDPSAFVPTYSGNVLNWNDAEIISIPVNSPAYMEISCTATQAANTGVGQIAGFVYEKPTDGTKSISISQEENLAMNNPVPNALVQLYKKDSAIPVASIFTDSQGAYQFDKLAMSDYEIVVEIPGYIQSAKHTIVLSAQEPSAKAYFGVDIFSKVITDNHSVQVSLINVYPNPTAGVINILGLQANVKNKISLYTLDGRQIMEKTIQSTSETVDIRNQVQGIYIIVINKDRFKVIKK